MQITTWNCARKKREIILPKVRALGSDFVLLQEIARPKSDSADELWIGVNDRQGLSVISCNAAPIRIAPEYDESLRYALPVEVSGEQPFHLLAIWMLKQPEHYVPNLVAILEHYRPFFKRAPTFVAGDFNANPKFDKAHRRYLFSAITKKFDELEFCSAYHLKTGESHGQEKQPTFFFRTHRDRPFHIDYCFIPKTWQRCLENVTVGGFDAFAGISDHRPLTVRSTT